jgi:hypothetical protein
MPPPTNQLDTIVAAMLAVSNYPVWKAQQVVPQLRAANLLDMDHLANLAATELAGRFVSAGYDRGALTSMYSERVRGLLVAVRDGKLDLLATHIAERDESAFTKLLTTIKGIGPSVASTAWILLTQS